MKKLFEMPAIELTKFDVEDVITASTGSVSDADFKAAIAEDGASVVVTTWNPDWTDAFGGI